MSFLTENGIFLVFDRTYLDVEAGTAKGFYNFSDIDRVNAAAALLTAHMNAVGGFSISTAPVLGTHTVESIPFRAEFRNTRENVRSLWAAYEPWDPTRLPDSFLFLNFERANDFERILNGIDQIVTRLPLNFFYSNEISAGEG